MAYEKIDFILHQRETISLRVNLKNPYDGKQIAPVVHAVGHFAISLTSRIPLIIKSTATTPEEIWFTVEDSLWFLNSKILLNDPVLTPGKYYYEARIDVPGARKVICSGYFMLRETSL